MPNTWTLRQVRDTKFALNKKLLNSVKIQGYSFYCFWVIKRKPTGKGEGKLPHPTTKIRVNLINHEPDFDKIYLNAKDPSEAKYQLLINKRESTGLKYLNDSKAFTEC